MAVVSGNAEQLQWQANSKRLISNVYLQHCLILYEWCVLNTHYPCIFFLPNNTEESSTAFKRVSVFARIVFHCILWDFVLFNFCYVFFSISIAFYF